LIECEVIDGEELASLIEASTGSPQIVPGTTVDARKAEPRQTAHTPSADRPPNPSIVNPG
jgi:hypothetical protein